MTKTRALSLFTLALAVAGCAPSSDPAPPTPAAPPASAATRVRLALNWFPEPEFGGFYEGVLGGVYEQAGFQVEIIPGGPGAPTLELLEAGKAEAAITAADDLLVKREKGARAVAVWAAFQLTRVGVLARADSGLQRIGDLGGRPELKVAIEVGSPFQRWLWQRHGWEGKVQAVPTTGSVAAFLADPSLVQQAYVTSEPCVARARGVEPVFLRASDEGWNPYGTVLAVADPPPAWVPAFVQATARAWQAYVEAPARANAELVRRNDQLDPALVECITQAQAPFLTGTDGLGAMTAERWQQSVDALVTVGLLKPDASAEGAWIVPQASPAAP
ncbi:ABC transporter substrate-binding protein [Myxococcota bacterium]|nr:ABC transporter substrate-binding protein [Myxococcota bacterium]